jgi:carboxylesterase type B
MIGNSQGKYHSTFDCLVNADSMVLQNASGIVSTSGLFGTFAFLPVVDGNFIQYRPAEQLSWGRVSGKRILVGVRRNFP